jgi:transcriptional regulator GlxA family with amidase domain
MSRHLSSIESWKEVAREAKFQPAAMAGLCSISLRQLERFFIEHFNKTPSAWTRELRCQVARELLEKGWRNKAVAAELHFANDSHLCHEFRKLYGSPPRAFSPTYRKSQNVAFLQ